MSESSESVERSPTKSVNRDARSDELKAAAIIGVVCIHAGLPYADVLRFCVPVFVAIWAFHYEIGQARRTNLWRYALQRLCRLLIPYAFWTVVYLVVFHKPTEWLSTPVHTIVGGWLGGYGWSGQYFFIVLFQLTLLFPIIRMLVTPKSIWFAIAIGGAFNAFSNYILFDMRILSGLGDRIFVYWLPYVFLGVGFARGFPPPRPWQILGVAALAAVPSEFAWIVETRGQGRSVYLLPSVFFGSVFVLLALGPRVNQVSLTRWSSLYVCSAVRQIGKQSFVIFLCNPLIIECSRRLVGDLDSSIGGVLCKVGIVIGATLGSMAVGYLFRRIGLNAVV